MLDSLSVKIIRAYSLKSGRTLPYDTLAASDSAFSVVSEGAKRVIPAGCAAFISENGQYSVEGEGEVYLVSFEATLYGSLALFSLYDLPDVLNSGTARAVIGSVKAAEKQFFTSVIENEIDTKLHLWSAVASAVKQGQPVEAQADIAGRHRVFAPVFEYIAAHEGETIAMEKLVALTEFTADAFYRAFKKTVGMPPRDYMLFRRLLYARRLLFTTDLSVKEISGLAGYVSPSAFGAVFAEKYGTAPGKYRSSVRNG